MVGDGKQAAALQAFPLSFYFKAWPELCTLCLQDYYWHSVGKMGLLPAMCHDSRDAPDYVKGLMTKGTKPQPATARFARGFLDEVQSTADEALVMQHKLRYDSLERYKVYILCVVYQHHREMIHAHLDGFTRWSTWRIV